MKLVVFALAWIIQPFSQPSCEAAVIATSSPYATQAAREILAQGGNAFDASCSAMFVLGVAQPYFTGIGGGGFALVSPRNGDVQFLNFREQAPKQIDEHHFYRDGKAADSRSQTTGAWSVGIPGNVAGCGEILSSWGKLTWAQVLDPAIRLARDGIVVTQLFSEEANEQLPRFDSKIPGMDTTFLFFGGIDRKGLKKGETLKQPVLAETLKELARGNAKGFYDGPLARAWRTEALTMGVNIGEKDLKAYRVIRQRPIFFKVGSRSGRTAPSPSRAEAKIAGVLKSVDFAGKLPSNPPPNSLARYLGQVEAMKKAIAQGPGHATKHTAHVSVIDDLGNAVALTSSIGDVFASGLTLSKHGFILNDTLSDFDVQAGRMNSPRGGKRPLSNMSPTFIYEGTQADPAKLIAVVGAAGGPLIPQAITQFLKNYFDYGMDARLAIEFGRVALDESGTVTLEKSVPNEVVEGLKKAGYRVEVTETIWAVLQGAVRRNSTSPWEAVSDPRYDGESWVGRASKGP